MRTLASLIIALLLCASPLSAQKSKGLSDSELAAITSRGRFLAEYNEAVRHAVAAVMVLNPPKGAVGRVIAKKTDAGWAVVFGRFNDAKDAFLILYQAEERGGASQFTVKTNDPPLEDTEFYSAASKAIEISLQTAELQKRPYNTYVLPLESGDFYVYILPAQTEKEIYPLGGDIRFLISADGSKIIETRRLHNTIMEINRTGNQVGKKLVGGIHTHVLTDTPEDTDVFHVLRQTTPLPETVGTRSGTYVVEKDGSIRKQ